MNLPPVNVVELLKAHGLHPKKRLGQNFMVDPAALQHVVDAAGVSSQDEILEIGAGLGSLTRLLSLSARRVVAVEMDRQLIPVLMQVMLPFENVTVIQGNILELDLQAILGEPGYLVVANIPYYITSAVFRKLLEASLKPRRIILTVQREVARRICSSPGDMSILSLSVQVFGTPQIVESVPAGAFYPAPQVDSAVVRVDLFPLPRIPVERLDLFFHLVKAGFSQKRKTLRNALSAGMRIPPDQAAGWLVGSGIDTQRRAETLSLSEWEALTQVFSDSGSS